VREQSVRFSDRHGCLSNNAPPVGTMRQQENRLPLGGRHTNLQKREKASWRTKPEREGPIRACKSHFHSEAISTFSTASYVNIQRTTVVDLFIGFFENLRDPTNDLFAENDGDRHQYRNDQQNFQRPEAVFFFPQFFGHSQHMDQLLLIDSSTSMPERQLRSI